MMKPPRIKQPLYRFGRYKVNQTEVRTMMLQIARKYRDYSTQPPLIDEQGTRVYFQADGKLSGSLYRFNQDDTLAMDLYRSQKKQQQHDAVVAQVMSIPPMIVSLDDNQYYATE